MSKTWKEQKEQMKGTDKRVRGLRKKKDLRAVVICHGRERLFMYFTLSSEGETLLWRNPADENTRIRNGGAGAPFDPKKF